MSSPTAGSPSRSRRLPKTQKRLTIGSSVSATTPTVRHSRSWPWKARRANWW
jgi:hypothetical protein